MQGLVKIARKSTVRIIDRATQNFTGARLGGWDIIEDGNVNFEGAGGNCHQQGNVIAEVSELACVTGRTLRGKVIGQDDVINAAKCAGGVVIAVSTSCLAWVQGLMLSSIQGERLLELRKLRYLLSDGYVAPLVRSLSRAVAFISPRIRGVQLLCELMRDSICNCIPLLHAMGILRVTRRPIGAYKQEISVPSSENNRGNPTIRIKECTCTMCSQGHTFLDTDNGAP